MSARRRALWLFVVALGMALGAVTAHLDPGNLIADAEHWLAEQELTARAR